MIEAGALEGVDAVIALHISSTRPAGMITTTAGWHSAAVDNFEAWLTAAGGHCAYPHEGSDPIWMLGPVLTGLYGIVSRRVNPMHPAVVSVGQVHAGTTNNVIPAEVYLEGTMRSFDPAVREQLIAEVERPIASPAPLAAIIG
jgi:amidohydrolase